MRAWIKIHILSLLALPAILLGGVHITTQAAMGAWAGLLAILWSVHLLSRPTSQRTVHLDGWFWLFAMALGVTWLQIIPLPLSWLAQISPQTDQVLRQTLGSVGLYNKEHWQPLSLAPPETTAKLIRDIGALLLYFVILQWAHQRSRLRWMMKVSVCIAGAIAMLSLLQTILGIHSPLLGIYHPRGSLGNPVTASPFINPNHMGAYYLFHALLCLSLLVETKSRALQAFWSGVLVLLSALILLSVSRGAILVYILSLGVFAVLYWFHRIAPLKRRKSNKPSRHKAESNDEIDLQSSQSIHRNRRMLSYLLAVFVVGVGLALLIGFTSLRQEISQTKLDWNQDKIGFITGHAKPLLQHYPWLGVGRGAMALAWHRFASEQAFTGGKLTITHIESGIVQPLIDWGIPLGILFVLGALFLLWQLLRRSRGFLEQSVLLALLALLLQNVGDFNLEYFGTAFPCLAFLAALQRLQSNRLKRHSRTFPWLSATLGSVGMLCIIWFTPYAYKHHFYRLPQRWKEVKSKSPPSLKVALQQLVQDHPSDFMLATYLARYYTFHKPWKPLEALQWLKRGAYLNPTAADIMMLRAYNLARLGLTQQTIQEIDRSVRNKPSLVRAAYSILKQFKMLPQALAFSQQTTLIRYIHRKRYQQHPHPSNYETSLQQSLQRFPKLFYLHQLMISYRLTQWRQLYRNASRSPTHRLSPTQRKRAVRLAYKRLQQSLRQIPKDSFAGRYTVSLIQGDIAATQGRMQKAEKYYRWAFQQSKGSHWRSFQSLFGVLLRSKQYDKARILLRTARRRFTSVHQKARMMYLDGTLLYKQGHLRYALHRFEYAVQLSPQKNYQLALAQLCWELGQHNCTLRIYRALVKDPRNRGLKKKLKWYEKKSHQK